MDDKSNDKHPYEDRPKVRKNEKRKQTHTGECNVRLEAETEIIQPQTKLLRTNRSKRGKEEFYPKISHNSTML